MLIVSQQSGGAGLLLDLCYRLRAFREQTGKKLGGLVFGGAGIRIAISGESFIGSYGDVLALEHDGRAYNALRNDVLLEAERQTLLGRR
jgi:hypothetical protein